MRKLRIFISVVIEFKEKSILKYEERNYEDEERNRTCCCEKKIRKKLG